MAIREIVKDLFKIETFVDNVLQCAELKEEGGCLEDGSIEEVNKKLSDDYILDIVSCEYLNRMKIAKGIVETHEMYGEYQSLESLKQEAKYNQELGNFFDKWEREQTNEG